MIVKFKDIFPDHNLYSNDDYLMNNVTDSLLREVSQTLPRLLIDRKQVIKNLSLDGTLQNMCNVVSLYTNNENTIHWGYNFIINDFHLQMKDFKHARFHKFMDAMLELSNFDETFKDALNEIFEDHNLGYRLTGDPDKPWACINPATGMVVDMDEVIVSTDELCEQTAEHIKQAKQQLTRAQELRARKDAIRDCLSAMEALMKHLTGTKDIDNADYTMRKSPDKWGQPFIVRDGITLWNMFHNKYRDIRHGDFDISKVSYHEAIYFVDKLLAYVKYISAKEIDNKNETVEF